LDKYHDFADLQRMESTNHYAIFLTSGTSDVAVIAPHGGGIEPGTSEIAQAIAGDEHTFYGFNGLKPNQNWDLHITSTHFDEPQCVAAVQNASKVLTIHGCRGNEAVIYTGGLDEELKIRIEEVLIAANFTVASHLNPRLQGRQRSNICNRNANHSGVQLELSTGLRKSMFTSLDRKGRQHRTQLFDDFVMVLRRILVPKNPCSD
jgi:phage replication-related protein YjqB (UPF0714/DUF867 family)